MDDKEIHLICKKYNIRNYKINNGLVDVDGDVNLLNIGLTELPLNFGEIRGDFYCGINELTTLASEIGDNKPYQEYLIQIEQVKVSQAIGIAQAESIANALSKADLKLLVNSGDVQSGIGKFSDIFTSKGASQINGLLEGLKQTDEGKGLLSLLENLNITKKEI